MNVANLAARLQAALGPSFAIERQLGGGGMSQVYLVADAALSRRIAVKLLRPNPNAKVDAERFRREIQIVARLQHPCIVPVLTTGFVEDIPYYTMPFVSGESLRAKITAGHQFSLPRAVRVIRDVASAIAYAHEHGVAHRDLKPDNVLLSSGYAVVTDFGIAKAASSVRGGDDAELTSAGMTVGTPAYMAPEQASADPAADHRVDIYALGVLAFEVLTGQRPINGRNAQELLVAQITRAPAEIKDLRPDLPPLLSSLVMRCLAKSPIERPSAGDVVDTLDTIASAVGVGAGTGTPTTPNAQVAALPSIAVLPFVNVSGNPDDEYLADGIAEEVLNSLARLRTMHVAARTSSFAFRGESIDLRTVGDRLGVRTVLEGSIRRSGKRLRVSVRLADVTNGFQLWSERYDRQDEDVFDVEDHIAASVVETLKVTLVNASGAPAPSRRSTNLDAYKLYLRGRHAWNQVGRGIESALDLFEQALELDPEFALAHAGMADVFIAAGIYETMTPAAAFPLAHMAAERARTLDESLSEAHSSLGAINLFYEWNFSAARAQLERAVGLNPSNVSAYNWLSLYYAFRGDTDIALDWARRGVKIDPLAAPASYGELFALFVARRCAEVIQCAERVLSVNPRYAEGYRCLGSCLLARGHTEAGLDALRTAAKVGGSSTWMVANLALGLAQLGHRTEAEELLAGLEKRARTDYVTPMTLGVVYGALGRTDDALAAIERSVEQRDCWVIALGVEPAYDSLRGNPRFEALVDQVGLVDRSAPRRSVQLV